MKLLLLLTSLLLSTAVRAQQPVLHADIIKDVPADLSIDEVAIETIVARNVVAQGAKAVYQAGKSVVLQPGFVARSGSVFLATIAPASTKPLVAESATLTLRALPNPFGEHLIIEYNSSRTGHVLSRVMNGSGQILQQSESEVKDSGAPHQIQVETHAWPTGVYYFQLQIGQESRTIKLIRK